MLPGPTLRNLGQRDAVLYSGVLCGCDHQRWHDAICCCAHRLLSRPPWGSPENPVGKESAPVVSQDAPCSVLEEMDFKRKTPRQPSSPEEYTKYDHSVALVSLLIIT